MRVLQFTGRRWKALDADRMVDEIAHLVRRHGFNALNFWDANWGVDQRRVFRFCEGILKRGIRLHWSATMESHILNHYDPAVIEVMAKSGCLRLLIGAEAGHPETLRHLGKNIDPDDVLRSCARIVRRKITARIYYIVGYPGESRESVRATIRAAGGITARWSALTDVCLSVYLPIPGTPMHAEAVREGYEEVRSIDGWRNHRDYRCGSHSSLEPNAARAVRRCMRDYFYWAAWRLREKARPGILERALHRTARLRLRFGWLGFPIEFHLYRALRRFRGLPTHP